MQIEVGKTYNTRDGHQVKIHGFGAILGTFLGNTPWKPYSQYNWVERVYLKDGSHWDGIPEIALISEYVPPAPAIAPSLHNWYKTRHGKIIHIARPCAADFAGDVVTRAGSTQIVKHEPKDRVNYVGIIWKRDGHPLYLNNRGADWDLVKKVTPYNIISKKATKKIVRKPRFHIECGKVYVNRAGNAIKISDLPTSRYLAAPRAIYLGKINSPYPGGDMMRFYKTGKHIFNPKLDLIKEITATTTAAEEPYIMTTKPPYPPIHLQLGHTYLTQEGNEGIVVENNSKFTTNYWPNKKRWPYVIEMLGPNDTGQKRYYDVFGNHCFDACRKIVKDVTATFQPITKVVEKSQDTCAGNTFRPLPTSTSPYKGVVTKREYRYYNVYKETNGQLYQGGDHDSRNAADLVANYGRDGKGRVGVVKLPHPLLQAGRYDD